MHGLAEAGGSQGAALRYTGILGEFKSSPDPDAGAGGANTRIEPQPVKIFQRYLIELEGAARPAVSPPRYTGPEGVVELLISIWPHNSLWFPLNHHILRIRKNKCCQDVSNVPLLFLIRSFLSKAHLCIRGLPDVLDRVSKLFYSNQMPCR